MKLLTIVILTCCAANGPGSTITPNLFPRFQLPHNVGPAPIRLPGNILPPSNANVATSIPSIFPILNAGFFPDNRIVGGRPVPLSNFPFQAALRKKGESHPFCGGSIIDKFWILTASHCLIREQGGNIQIVVGTVDLRYPRVLLDVEKIIIHPKYMPMLGFNDIALIKTRQPAIVKGTAAITLPMKNQTFIGRKGVVSGFGALSEGGGTGSPFLMATILDIISDSICFLRYWLMYRPDIMMCAGYIFGGYDSCQGDSGGPLSVRIPGGHIQAGIVASGKGCARTLTPGIYVKVSSFVDWIRQQIELN